MFVNGNPRPGTAKCRNPAGRNTLFYPFLQWNPRGRCAIIDRKKERENPMHGGTLEIANAEGGGAVVTIRLPIEAQ